MNGAWTFEEMGVKTGAALKVLRKLSTLSLVAPVHFELPHWRKNQKTSPPVFFVIFFP